MMYLYLASSEESQIMTTEPITSPADSTNITWMCENEYHGTRERATYAANGFTYNGHCSGFVMTDFETRNEAECACLCHVDGFVILL